MDASSRLDMRLGYQNSSLEAPASASTGSEVDARQRGFDAAGRYERIASTGHRIDVAFQAGRRELPDPRIRGTIDGGAIDPFLPSGSYARFRSEDTWTMTGRASLVYGLGYYAPLDGSAGRAALVPRLGGALSGRHMQGRLVVAWHGGSDPRARSEGSLGIEADAQVRLPRDVLFRGTFASAPTLRDGAHTPGRDAGTEGRSIFITDGDASRREATLGLERRAGPVAAYGRFATGSASGMLSVPALDRVPVAILSEERIAYRAARAGFRLVSTGTDVSGEWCRVTQDPGARRSLEVRLAQEVARRRASGAIWNVLLACRRDRADDAAAPDPAGRLGTAPSLREIRGGVSVAF
jgi:hypothetical protein